MSGVLNPTGSLDSSVEPVRFLELVERQARLRGEQPWLFFREGHGWRWWSWQRAWLSLKHDAAPAESGPESGRGSARLPEARPERAVEWHLRELRRCLEAQGPRPEQAEVWARQLGSGFRKPAFAWRLLRLPRSRPLAVDGGLPEGSPLRWLGWMWSAERGSGLVVPSGSDDFVDAVLWSRPTVLWCDQRRALELTERLLAGSRPARRARAGLKRLSRLLVITAASAESAGEAEIAGQAEICPEAEPEETSRQASAIREVWEDQGVDVVFWRTED